MYKRILVAIAGSETSNLGLRHAIQLAGARESDSGPDPVPLSRKSIKNTVRLEHFTLSIALEHFRPSQLPVPRDSAPDAIV